MWYLYTGRDACRTVHLPCLEAVRCEALARTVHRGQLHRRTVVSRARAFGSL